MPGSGALYSRRSFGAVRSGWQLFGSVSVCTSQWALSFLWPVALLLYTHMLIRDRRGGDNGVLSAETVEMAIGADFNFPMWKVTGWPQIPNLSTPVDFENPCGRKCI